MRPFAEIQLESTVLYRNLNQIRYFPAMSSRRRIPTNNRNQAQGDDDDDYDEEEENEDSDDEDEEALQVTGTITNRANPDLQHSSDDDEGTAPARAAEAVVVAESEALVDSSRGYGKVRSVHDEPDILLEEFLEYDEKKEKQVTKFKTTCRQCGKYWNWKNATKIVNHLAKKGGQASDCAPCTVKVYIKLDGNGSPILGDDGKPIEDPEIGKRYLARYNERMSKRKRKEESSSMLSLHVEQHQAKLASNVQASKRRKVTGTSDKFTTPKTSSFFSGTKSSSTKSSSTPKSNRPLEPGQTQIITTSPQRDDELSCAIADWIHSNGLPFSTVEDPKFKIVIRKAKFVNPNKYKFPSRTDIGGRFLDQNYKTLQDHLVQQLAKDSEVFGVALFVDLATIKRMPMLNVLGSGVHQPAACLTIKDCTSQLSMGMKKTGRYIATIVEEKMEMLAKAGCVVDTFFSDGGSNVVKAGRILMAKYKGLYAFHGAEHVMSLLLLDIFKMRYCGMLKMFYRKIYSLFGGSKHEPYAVFCNCSALSNNEKKVTLLRPADTRMGGWVYCLARMFRLKEPLRQALTEANVKKWKVDPKMVAILEMKNFWTILYHFLRMCYAPLKILRLADRKEPGMDKLYYFVRLTDKMLKEYRRTMNLFAALNGQVLEHLERFLLPNIHRNRTRATMKTANENWAGEFTQSKDEEDDDGSRSDGVDEEQDEEDEDDDEEDRWEKYPDGEDDGEDEDPVPEEVTKRLGGDGREAIVQQRVVRSILLGDVILKMWEKRREPLCHPYAFAAWITSPCPEIMKDAIPSNINQYHKNAVNELVLTWCGKPDMTVSQTSKLLNDFWEQHRQFSSKIGPVFSNDYIWQDELIAQNRSYFWHMKHTLSSVVPFGVVAVKSQSKILGIGSAERAWKDVKQLKQGNRSHLSGPAVEKQATMYGAYSAQKAAIRHEVSLKHGGYEKAVESAFWNDQDDFGALKLGPYGQELDREFKHARSEAQEDDRKVFKCYMEKWELVHWWTKGDEHADALLKKYKKVKIIDHDKNERVLTVNHVQMRWERKEWQLEMLTDDYDPENERTEDYYYWRPNNDFYGCAYDYIQKYSKHEVRAITLPGQLKRNKEWETWGPDIPKEP